jgi:ABC-type multidrug transport system permease subunit
VLAVGLLVGFRFHTTTLHAAIGITLALLFGYACSWLFAFLALLVRQTETAQLAAFLVTFPLAFASSIYAAPTTMPTWLRDFAGNQPVSKVVDALRGLTETRTLAARPLLYAVAWSLGLLIVASVLATRRFRQA